MSPHTATTEVTIALALVKTLVLLVGSVITYFALKAYRRTNQRALGFLAVGFGLVTLGLAFAGLLHEVIGVSLEVGVLVESALVLVGFLVIAYSLYVQ